MKNFHHLSLTFAVIPHQLSCPEKGGSFAI